MDGASGIESLAASGIRFGRTALVPTRGPILAWPVDTIVVPANRRGVMGVGFGGRIRAIGGPDIEREAMKNAPLTLGTAITTTAGDLAARNVHSILHAVITNDLGQAGRESDIRLAIEDALRQAERTRAKVIAIPLLGAGNGTERITREESLPVMMEEILGHLRRSPSRIETIIIVCANVTECQSAAHVLDHMRRNWWGPRG